MDLHTKKQLFDTLFDGVDGYALSLSGRKKLDYYDKGFTYGEILPETFMEALQKVNPKEGETFFDVGSGTGKALIAAALFFPFRKVVGIEVIEDLYRTSGEVTERFKREMLPLLPHKTTIQVLHGDFIDAEVGDVDIVFAHATCFHDGNMKQLQRKLDFLKKGARAVIVSKPLISPLFQETGSQEMQFGWGKATVFFYTKTI